MAEFDEIGRGNPPSNGRDEWVRVGELLGDERHLLATSTRLGTFLRAAVLRLSDPDVSDEELDTLRRFVDDLNRIAGTHRLG